MNFLYNFIMNWSDSHKHTHTRTYLIISFIDAAKHILVMSMMWTGINSSLIYLLDVQKLDRIIFIIIIIKFCGENWPRLSTYEDLFLELSDQYRMNPIFSLKMKSLFNHWLIYLSQTFNHVDTNNFPYLSTQLSLQKIFQSPWAHKSFWDWVGLFFISHNNHQILK